MRTWPLWIASALVAAVIVHIVTVLLLPPSIMTLTMARMADAGADAGVVHAPPPDANSRSVVRPSPDLAYSICLYDLDDGPLLVTAKVPDTYWSLSAYAHNTDNFFVVNDQQMPGDELRLLIKREKDDVPGFEGVPVSFAPTDRGIVLMRMLVTDRDSYLKNDAVRRAASCETVAQ